MRILQPDETGIAEAAAAIAAGEVVAYPTETVYGLAVNPFDESALRRLFELKGRPDTNPVLLVVSEIDALDALVTEISPQARRLMEHFWPGPLSLILPARPGLPHPLTVGTGKVCVRLSASDIATRLAHAAGGAITSTSANRTGEPPATALDQLEIPGLTFAIDGGALPSAQPSTIYDTTTDTILRPGKITEAQIAALI